MLLGKKIRLSRIFDTKTNTAVIVPMDHAIEGYFKELEDPRKVIGQVVNAGADALLLRRGLAEYAASEYQGRVGLIYRVTCASGLGKAITKQPFISTVEEAMRLGADAVVSNLFLGADNEPESLKSFGALSEACNKWGIPNCAEVFPIGGKDATPFDGPYSPDDVRVAIRVVGEEGADFIKSYYTGDPETFKEVVRYSLVPIVIAGGPKVEDANGVLQMVKDAMDAGAAGICMGRKIWGAPNPEAMIKALAIIVREKVSVEEAMKSLK